MRETALLIVGHGTRDPRGQSQFLDTVETTRQQLSNRVVRHAWLKFHSPDIATGLGQLADDGVERVVIVPLLLFEAGHWRRDLPAHIRQATRQHPTLQITYTHAIASHPKTCQLAVSQFARTIDGHRLALEQTVLLVVGRGSPGGLTDPDCRDLGHRIARQTNVGKIQLAFLEMRQPRLADAIASVSDHRFRWVVVMPLLLFNGELVDRIRRTINDEQERRSVRQQFLLSPPLGANSALVDVVLDLYRANDKVTIK